MRIGASSDRISPILGASGTVEFGLVKPTLAGLLAQIRPGDRFDEVDYGPPRGREVL